MAVSSPVDHFSWYQKIPLLSHAPDYIVHAGLVGLVILVASLIAHRQIVRTQADIRPDSRLTLKNMAELLTEFILNLLRGVLDKHAEKYLPLIGAIFIFIFLSNILGLIPGFQPPTANLNTNLAIAITVFVYYQFLGFKENGIGYLKHFMGPIWGLAPLMLVIELISHFVRPVSLSLRLFGNMTGDHMVMNIFSNLTYFGVPIIFLAMGLLVSLIQAFVFSLLSIVYIGLATAHEH